MRDVEYRGRTIEPQSYQSYGGLWHPKAIVVTSDGGSVQTLPLFGPSDRTFATEDKANAYAVEMAKKWINERG